MSARFLIRGTWCFLPKMRIRRKIEKPEARERYEQWCRRRLLEAKYNSYGLLCWVEIPEARITKTGLETASKVHAAITAHLKSENS